MPNDPLPADLQDPEDPQTDDQMVEFTADKRGGISRRVLGSLMVGLIVLNVFAFIVVPPFNKDNPDETCTLDLGSVGCFVNGTLHIPAPHEVWVAGGAEPDEGLLIAQISLTDSLVTMLVITLLVTIVMVAVTRGRKDVPGFFQNFSEWAYESMSNWSLGMGGTKAARYIPIFAAFFILILAFNWSGLLPGIGVLPWTRAPTSDLNVTVGLALFSFGYFQFQGFKHLGIGGYLSKFFPLYEFKKGFAAGLIAMFVGFIEFILELVKPLTLSMRLFGNIFGGEVALGVVIGLTGAFLIPVVLYGLEVILTFVQALIFSTLTLMFVLAAIESHQHEEGHAAEDALEALEDATHQTPATT